MATDFFEELGGAFREIFHDIANAIPFVSDSSRDALKTKIDAIFVPPTPVEIPVEAPVASEPAPTVAESEVPVQTTEPTPSGIGATIVGGETISTPGGPGSDAAGGLEIPSGSSEPTPTVVINTPDAPPLGTESTAVDPANGTQAV